MQLIDGKLLAQNIQNTLKADLDAIKGRRPGLAFLLVGQDPASQAYVLMKKRRCGEIGIHSTTLHLPKTVFQKGLLKEIKALNANPHIDGILIQQPLPMHLSTPAIVQAIDPEKDVDGFHPMNMGKLFLGERGGLIPCTPLGILKLLQSHHLETKGKHVVILGRSNIVGKPLAALLVQKGIDSTVTLAHSQTKHLKEICQNADILIAAIGKPRFVQKEMVKQGAVVIDVGINRTKEGLVGDVDFDQVKERCAAITPVPGGVGPMTIAMLLSNTFQSYRAKAQANFTLKAPV